MSNHTIDDVRNSLRELSRTTGNPGTPMQVLAKFCDGEPRLSALQPRHFQAVIDELQKAMHLSGASLGTVRAQTNERRPVTFGQADNPNQEAREYWDDLREKARQGEPIPKYDAPTQPGSPDQERLFRQIKRNRESMKQSNCR